jgi:hypothetical protein
LAVSIDINKYQRERKYGDITAVYSYINDERALILVQTYRKGGPWFCVLESAAYTWDDESPENVPEVIRKASKACEVLGLEATPRNIQRIAAIVIDSLPDLISMPSSPQDAAIGRAVGEMHLREDGKIIKSELIRDTAEAPAYG